jgi:glycerol-3-phosphate dehydrogenase
MENASSDIFIIGGGINGVGIAVDAAGRGLSVTLCEKNDLASATSSASSKLIHGGLRYLATYDFSLVRKALQEREILLCKAPHLIWPLEFILPRAKHLRPGWLIRLGLFIYDHLASHPLLPNSKKINLSRDTRGAALQPDLKLGFSYYDCYDDDARLVVTNAIAAIENNATILTHTTCISATYLNDQWKIELKNNFTHEISIQYAKVLINAAGPWVQSVQQNIIQNSEPFSVELIKGTHIIVPKLYDGDFAYILQNPDERVVFAIPYQNKFTLIGTTDVPYKEELNRVSSTPEEETYLCDTINQYFKKAISPDDIVWSYAGVRCLQDDKKENASEITRDYKFIASQQMPLVTIISGKVTTYRRLAEEVVDSLQQYFPQKIKSAWTAQSVLPGGDIPHGDFDAFYTSLCTQYSWLPKDIAHRYARAYGTRVDFILQHATCLADLGESFAAGLYQKEVEYLIQQEWARTSEDILWRRTKLGLFFTAADIEKLERSLSAQN